MLCRDKLTAGDGFSISSYDGNGSLLTVVSGGVTKTFTYDPENRVATLGFSHGLSPMSFLYNGEGTRVEKVDGSGTTRYIYDGATIVADTNSAGTITRYYLPGVGWIDGTTQHYDLDNGIGSSIGDGTAKT